MGLLERSTVCNSSLRMVQKTLTGIRFPAEMLKRIDAYAHRLRTEQPGLEVNRAVAIRMLITRGLETVEQKKPKR